MLGFFNLKEEDLEQKKLVCFGAGGAGKSFLDNYYVDFMGYTFEYFTDNNRDLYGNYVVCSCNDKYKVQGIEIISLEAFIAYCQKEASAVIIITSMYYDEIKKQLLDIGLGNLIVSCEEVSRLAFYHFIHKKIMAKSVRLAQEYLTDFLYKSTVHCDFTARLCFQKVINKKEGIFMFSPPKVGNSTLCYSLRAHNKLIIDAHILPLHVPKIFRISLKEEAKVVIIGVREPIAQNISLLFELSNYEFVGGAHICLDKSINDMDAQEVFDKYIVDKYMNPENYNPQTISFDTYLSDLGSKEGKYQLWRQFLVQEFFYGEILTDFGFNIFKYSFDKEKGFTRYRNDGKDYFVYRIENLNGIKEELADFCGMKDLELINANLAENKFYNECYRKFKKNFKMPKEFFEKVYHSEYMRFFYTDDEIGRFMEKWKENIV